MRIDIKDLDYKWENIDSVTVVYPKFTADLILDNYRLIVGVGRGIINKMTAFKDGKEIKNKTKKQISVFDGMVDELKLKTKFGDYLLLTDFLFEMVGQSHLTEGETEVIEFEDLEEFEMGGLWRINKLIKKENK